MNAQEKDKSVPDVLDGLRDIGFEPEFPRERAMAVQSTFLGSRQGRETLAWICGCCGLFSLATNEKDMVLQNFAKELLTVCGLWGGHDQADIVEALMHLPAKKEPSNA
jgi:hypothetical protein